MRTNRNSNKLGGTYNILGHWVERQAAHPNDYFTISIQELFGFTVAPFEENENEIFLLKFFETISAGHFLLKQSLDFFGIYFLSS